MTFFAFGFNYTTSSLDYREQFAFNSAQLDSLHQRIELSESAEWVLLSTCNRTECFLAGQAEDVVLVKNALASQAGVEWDEA